MIQVTSLIWKDEVIASVISISKGQQFLNIKSTNIKVSKEIGGGGKSSMKKPAHTDSLCHISQKYSSLCVVLVGNTWKYLVFPSAY